MPSDPLKILVVDDEPLNIQIIKEHFEGDDFQIHSADSGKDALRVADEIVPDIILLDVMMPGLSGYEVCKEIRANKRLCFTKTIMVSARTMLNDRLKGYESGANDYITKPFEPQELLAKINSFKELEYAQEIEGHKNTLIRFFAHQIRTPLNSILGFASILEQEKVLNEHQKFYIGNILSSGNALLSLSQKYLNLHELNKGVALKPVMIELEQLLKACINKFDDQLKVRGVHIAVSGNLNKKVFVDPIWMGLALEMIVENAIDCTKPEGMINLSVEEDAQRVRLLVQDQGTGIDKDAVVEIFEEFPIENQMSVESGHSLGIIIAKKIVNLHHGQFKLVSNTAQGCIFMIGFDRESTSLSG